MVALASVALAACSPDEQAQTQQREPAQLAPNTAPGISGTPVLSATVGQNYEFAPTAYDAEGGPLTWSIQGLPAGATFNNATGTLNWTPGTALTTAPVVISVTDNHGASASLPAFSIVSAAPVAAPVTGSAVLSWQPPTQYVDGTMMPTDQLGGFRVYHGDSETTLARVAEVDSNTSTMTLQDLGAGTHYFAVTALTVAGLESSYSVVGSKRIM